MSEGEQMGRCRSEVDRSGSGGPVTNAIASAIDRLAADLAAVKGAVCDRSGWPVGWLIEVDRLIRLRDEARAEVEKLKAMLEQQPPAAPQPAAPPPGWLTEREQHALRHILAADVEPAIRSLLARAGSPPVVEVPALGFLGAMTGREQGIVLAYRDALDKVGVKWKEVPRE